jgi:hypothetical protein
VKHLFKIDDMKKTAMQILKAIVIEIKSKGHEIDINGLEDWINSVGERIEKEQIINAFDIGLITGDLYYGYDGKEAEQYYNKTFNE